MTLAAAAGMQIPQDKLNNWPWGTLLPASMDTVEFVSRQLLSTHEKQPNGQVEPFPAGKQAAAISWQ